MAKINTFEPCIACFQIIEQMYSHSVNVAKGDSKNVEHTKQQQIHAVAVDNFHRNLNDTIIVVRIFDDDTVSIKCLQHRHTLGELKSMSIESTRWPQFNCDAMHALFRLQTRCCFVAHVHLNHIRSLLLNSVCKLVLLNGNYTPH